MNNLGNGHGVFFNMRHPGTKFHLGRRMPGGQDLDVTHILLLTFFWLES